MEDGGAAPVASQKILVNPIDKPTWLCYNLIPLKKGPL